MSGRWYLLAALAASCIPPRHPERPPDFGERNRRVLECLGDARSPLRQHAPEIRIGAGRPHAGDMRTYIVVDCQFAGLEHELVHFYRISRAHDELSERCGDELSRRWRREHPPEPCKEAP